MKALLQIAFHKSSSSGQAIIELLISLAVLIVVVVALLTTVNFSLSAVNISRNKSISITYAQEGLELARQQREIDWQGLSDPTTWPVNPNGSIANTLFTRTVTVSDLAPGQKEIESVVSWSIDGRAYQTALSTVLTDWR